MTDLPTTIPAYLERLRRALAGSDPALVQDALYDAEEYLRSELAENPGKSEAEVIAAVASSYGAPDEVAEIYRDTEVRVQGALQVPRAGIHASATPFRAAAIGDAPPPASAPLYEGSWLRRVFGVFVDARTYGALFYMLLALATGIFYFTWTVTGMSLSAGLAILVVGLPFFVLFVAASRVLALVEGRIVEVMLGERMPRRPLYTDRAQPLLRRIAAMFADPRTWSTFLYFLLMLPLGIVYFTVVVAGITSAVAMVAAPLFLLLHHFGWLHLDYALEVDNAWLSPLVFLAGVALLVGTLHVARGIGRMHGRIAKQLLVKEPAPG